MFGNTGRQLNLRLKNGNKEIMADLEKRCELPGADKLPCSSIEVSFGIPCYLSLEQDRRLYEVLSDIVMSPVNQPVEGVHWLAGTGCKPSWSQIDAAFLGKTVDPGAPESGEPTFSRDTYSFECCARSFVSEEERARVLERRQKKLDRPKSGAARITDERQRQKTQEGYTEQHDATHVKNELLLAALCYAMPEGVRGQLCDRSSVVAQWWPWPHGEFKPTDRIAELTKAGALIAAEIDRILREHRKQAEKLNQE